MFPLPSLFPTFRIVFLHVCLQNQIDPAIKPEIMLKTPTTTTTMWFLRIEEFLRRNKKQKVKEKEKEKKVKVYFLYLDRDTAHTLWA